MARFRRINMYGLDSFILFGKYDGMQIEDIIEDDPSYIAWMYEQDNFGFNEDVLKVLEEKKII